MTFHRTLAPAAVLEQELEPIRETKETRRDGLPPIENSPLPVLTVYNETITGQKLINTVPNYTTTIVKLSRTKWDQR